MQHPPKPPLEGRWPGYAGSEGWMPNILDMVDITDNSHRVSLPPLSRLRRQLPLRGALKSTPYFCTGCFQFAKEIMLLLFLPRQVR